MAADATSVKEATAQPVGNRAAWISALGEPLQVKEAPYPEELGHQEVVVRNHAVGLAIADYYHQYLGLAVKNLPHIAGTDSAGIITAVGSAVPPSLAKPGDRVICCGKVFNTSNPAHGTWQLYTIFNANQVAKLPDSISFVQGAVLPLAICTAIAGLFQDDTMGLPLPPLSSALKTDARGEVVIISGGSTSVGLCAIQLLHAAGYTVAATASAKHHPLLDSLGVAYVFDRSSETLDEDIVAALRGKKVVGVYETVGGFAGAEQKPLLMAINVAQGAKKVVTVDLTAKRPTTMSSEVELLPAHSMMPFLSHPHVGEYIFGKWMEGALQDGALRPLPEPLVVGRSLEAINAGILRVKEGLSGQKVVIELP